MRVSKKTCIFSVFLAPNVAFNQSTNWLHYVSFCLFQSALIEGPLHIITPGYSLLHPLIYLMFCDAYIMCTGVQVYYYYIRIRVSCRLHPSLIESSYAGMRHISAPPPQSPPPTPPSRPPPSLLFRQVASPGPPPQTLF